MEILKIRSLRGPNYWSNYRKKLIVVKLDLREFEELPTNLLGDFTPRLKKLLPSLYNHRCSSGVVGGLFRRLESGTWLGHVIEHIALELQWLAGMKCGYGRTRTTQDKGVYNVVFSYEIENAGIYAAKAAISIAETLAQNKDYEFLEQDLQELKKIYDAERLGPSTEAILEEAQKRDIPFTRLDDGSLIMLGQGCNQKIICATVCCSTSSIAVETAADKEMTKDILAKGLIPVPQGKVIHSFDELEEAIEGVGFPLVIKPQRGNHGRGITTNIRTKEKAVFAYDLARRFSDNILIEKYISGRDYRLLVVNFKLIAVAMRTPAKIIGTGLLSIQELIDKINQDPIRGEYHENLLTKIKVDEVTLGILKEKGMTLETILPQGQVLYLKDAANLSSGGTATDVTDDIHPSNIFLAQRVARLLNIDICGIDIITEDISKPITADNGAVLEVNAGPGLRMHLKPSIGKGRNCAEPIVDMLYPKGKSSRIPLVAVTGTNGKTTVVRLIAHFARMAGHSVGVTTTEGIYINDQEILAGDCSGPASAEIVLRDPMVDFAVLECARGGILRSGLGFDKCSISVLTNISEDHVGADDINSIEDLARVKAVIPHSTIDDGYAILNADDDLVYSIKEELHCKIALFSMHANHLRLEQHCANGGLAAYIDDAFIVIREGDKKVKLAKLVDIPLSFSGNARCMIQNMLPAVLAGVISHFAIVDIAAWLCEFAPTVENIPGRMNLFNFDNFKVLVDYAHNENAFIELRDFIKKIDCNKKVGIVAATGDRRSDDIRKVGFYAAQTFDEIIIRHDKDGRGRTNQELTALIIEGIKQANPTADYKIISNEYDAIKYAMDNAESGTFIHHFPDDVLTTLDFMKQITHQYQSYPSLLVGSESV